MATRRVGPDRWVPGRLTLEEVHGSLPTAVDDPGDYSRNDVPAGSQESSASTSTPASTTSTSTLTAASPFHEALNEYLLTPRPKSPSDVRNLSDLVVRLARLCGRSGDLWKVFILVAFHRRYHALAPAAKLRKAQGDSDGADDTSGGVVGDGDGDGDGERLVFYITCLTLNRLSKIVVDSKQDGTEDRAHLLEAASLALIKAAPEVGGTRDVNALIEHLTFQSLLDRGHVRLKMADRAYAPRSFHKLLLPALRTMMEGGGAVDMSLDLALETAANLLDGDLTKCARRCADVKKVEKETKEDKKEEADDGIMSTIHVTLPHRDRGSAGGASFQRKLVNCVAEVLVWERTEACRKETRFSHALAGLKHGRAEGYPTNDDKEHDALMRMQTTARKKRQVLNDEARSRGYMLCSLYLKDRTLLTFGQVLRGKAGDLSMLKKLASKAGDKRVLKMLAARGMDSSKATPIESVGSLVRQWQDTNSMPLEGSVEALELELQAQTVRVTVQKLRSKVRGETCSRDDDAEEEEGARRRVLVTALGRRRTDATCAILVAAALCPYSRLLIQGEEIDVSSEDKVMEALNGILVGEYNPSNHLTAQAVLQEELGEYHDVVFVCSTDVEVDETILKRLQEEGKTVRVHSTSRVELIEPLTIELDDEISDKLRLGCPVSVAVLLDCTGSMGTEIQGCKEGALKAIDAFNDLAPVRSACFLGYWDPVNSGGDPNPRSTGFLDPRRKENLEEIQQFVNTQLPCMGGGDEPEDVPAALEKLLGDIKSAGLSSDNGVHFIFFIADAGYRHNEDGRVSSLLRQLKQFGVVMVMCPVRNYGTCQTLVAKNQEVFRPGKYIEVQGVSALGTIASSVTESIRASLFKQGNVASVTASVGETMDSLCQLVGFQEDHSKMKRVAELSAMSSGAGEGTEDGIEDDKSDDNEEDEMEEMLVSEEPGAAKKSDENAGSKSNQSTPIFVPSNTFSVTNIDRIYIQISRLPEVCHRVVEGTFGGKSLQEILAIDIARRLVKQAIPVSKLREAGYPPSIVDLVRNTMGGHGLHRQHQVEQQL